MDRIREIQLDMDYIDYFQWDKSRVDGKFFSSNVYVYDFVKKPNTIDRIIYAMGASDAFINEQPYANVINEYETLDFAELVLQIIKTKNITNMHHGDCCKIACTCILCMVESYYLCGLQFAKLWLEYNNFDVLTKENSNEFVAMALCISNEVTSAIIGTKNKEREFYQKYEYGHNIQKMINLFNEFSEEEKGNWRIQATKFIDLIMSFDLDNDELKCYT